MSEIKIIDLEEADALTNDEAAAELREELKNMGVFMLNLMGAPGSGKTEVLWQTIPRLQENFQTGCMCTDLDTTLDAERIAEVCDHVIQFHVGGMWPYVSADGSRTGLMEMISEDVNVVMLENLGVLISAAAWDTGATMNVVVVSATGGPNTSLKYSYMFAICDVVIVNKADLAGVTGFDLEKCKENIHVVNENAHVFVVSAKTGEGVDEWVSWLSGHIREYVGG